MVGGWDLTLVKGVLEKHIGRSAKDQQRLLGFELSEAFDEYPHTHQILTQKGLWRSWLWDYPVFCAPDSPPAACSPRCRNSVDAAAVARTFFMFLCHVGGGVGAPNLASGASGGGYFGSKCTCALRHAFFMRVHIPKPGRIN